MGVFVLPFLRWAIHEGMSFTIVRAYAARFTVCSWMYGWKRNLDFRFLSTLTVEYPEWVTLNMSEDLGFLFEVGLSPLEVFSINPVDSNDRDALILKFVGDFLLWNGLHDASEDNILFSMNFCQDRRKLMISWRKRCYSNGFSCKVERVRACEILALPLLFLLLWFESPDDVEGFFGRASALNCELTLQQQMMIESFSIILLDWLGAWDGIFWVSILDCRSPIVVWRLWFPAARDCCLSFIWSMDFYISLYAAIASMIFRIPFLVK